MWNQLEILEKKVLASFLTVCTVLFVFHPAPDTSVLYALLSSAALSC